MSPSLICFCLMGPCLLNFMLKFLLSIDLLSLGFFGGYRSAMKR